MLGYGLLILGCLLGWNYARDRATDTLVMTILCLVLSAIHLQWLGSRLTCTHWGMAWHRPGQGLREIPWHEIQDVQLVGRVTKHVQIEYIEQDEEWLSLPRMQDQAQLYRQIRLRLGLPAEGQ